MRGYDEMASGEPVDVVLDRARGPVLPRALGLTATVHAMVSLRDAARAHEIVEVRDDHGKVVVLP